MPHWFVLVAIALVAGLLGFRKFIWFVSIGYAFSVAGMVVGMVFLFWERLTPALALALGIVLVYSLRLGLFLVAREARGGAYTKVLEEATSGVKKVPLFISLLVWLFVAFLFFAQLSPLYFRLENGLAVKDPYLLLAGIFIMALGLAVQTTADMQKATAKKLKPDRYCDTGLYRIVRCPNYLGELLVWTGVVAGSVSCLATPWQWLVSMPGYVGIVFIMFNGARRLEKRQTARYGSDAGFQVYVAKVPILIPLLPLYSLKAWNFLG